MKACSSTASARRPPVHPLTVLACVLLTLVGWVVAPAAGAAPAVEARVLLLGTSAVEPDFTAWQAELERRAVPFDALIASPGHTPISASTLSARLVDGGEIGRYDAVVVPVGDLVDCTSGSCVSDLSTAQWKALEQYERDFGVRQITGDVYPSAAYGLAPPTASGALGGTAATLTGRGRALFPYLHGGFGLDAGTNGYEAVPIVGASFVPLVAGPAGSTLAGIYTHADGVQELVETFTQNRGQLLRQGALAWATRDAHFPRRPAVSRLSLAAAWGSLPRTALTQDLAAPAPAVDLSEIFLS